MNPRLANVNDKDITVSEQKDRRVPQHQFPILTDFRILVLPISLKKDIPER